MPLVKAIRSNIKSHCVSNLKFTYTTKKINKTEHIDIFKLAKWVTIKTFAAQASSLTVFKPSLTSSMSLPSQQ